MEGTLAKPQSSPVADCHGEPPLEIQGLPVVAIVGSPNVGKSELFNKLTGMYATVSNYPGTTVEVMRGRFKLGEQAAGLLDTPGMYNLTPITEEERVARRILIREHPDAVVHVVDAKNMERMLPMTLQLIEAGLPVILVVNMMDEAERLGIELDLAGLGEAIGIPVVGAALVYNRGVDRVKKALADAISPPCQSSHCECKPLASQKPRSPIRYPEAVEAALEKISGLLAPYNGPSGRTVGLFLLQGDAEIARLLQPEARISIENIKHYAADVRSQFSQPLEYVIDHAQRQAALQISSRVMRVKTARSSALAARLSDLMIHPLTGFPILLAALFMLYQFVGVFGAQILVNWLETNLFGAVITPWVDAMLGRWVPWPAVQSLIGGEFGMVTLGLRYAIAIILPIVGTFFIAFSIIEDSGYLPRLALLIDRLFKQIGLNGRAVIPMVLGFGCDTMATITTRTLETRRERVISTLLLSLAIPCSAQLGVMLALLSASPWLLGGWLFVMCGVFLLVGYLTKRLLPGENPTFFMELPPLRLPRLRNIFIKTYTRMEWYLREVFPLFIIASVVIWAGTLTGLFDLAVAWLTPVVRWLGLPDATAVAFLFGFFRRDYGAAGLYDLRASMNNAQLLVAVTSMTLFVPCIAQFSVMVKERGWKTALAMGAFIFPFALMVGGTLAAVLRLTGFDL